MLDIEHDRRIVYVGSVYAGGTSVGWVISFTSREFNASESDVDTEKPCGKESSHGLTVSKRTPS